MSALSTMHPLTSSGHLVSLEARPLVLAMRPVLAALYSYGEAEVHEPVAVGRTLPAALEYLASCVDGQFPSRLLFLETRNRRTAIFNNAWRSRGWYEMAFPVMKQVPAVEEDIFFSSQPHTIRRVGAKLEGQYGGIQLIRLAAGRVVRSLYLINDGDRGWVFSQRGEPAPFERLEQYKARKRSERFCLSAGFFRSGHHARCSERGGRLPRASFGSCA
jgi:hypothetical protein